MKTVSELMSLEGRVAIVTGATGHIGYTFCEVLAEAGANITVLDISENKCKDVAKKVGARFSTKTLPLAVDLSQESQIRAVPKQVLEKFGRIDILINCAAFVGTSDLEGWITPFEEQSADTWRKALEVNLTSVFILTQVCTPELKKKGNAAVINIGSIYGMLGPDMRLYEGVDMGHPAAYAASKGGIIQLTRWLSTVLAPDIRVNSISPGGVFRNQPESFQEKYVARTPLKRMGTEEDIKGACIFLASDLSLYVTGQNIAVDGGWTTW